MIRREVSWTCRCAARNKLLSLDVHGNTIISFCASARGAMCTVWVAKEACHALAVGGRAVASFHLCQDIMQVLEKQGLAVENHGTQKEEWWKTATDLARFSLLAIDLILRPYFPGPCHSRNGMWCIYPVHFWRTCSSSLVRLQSARDQIIAVVLLLSHFFAAQAGSHPPINSTLIINCESFVDCLKFKCYLL